jgi:hypothetical protein
VGVERSEPGAGDSAATAVWGLATREILPRRLQQERQVKGEIQEQFRSIDTGGILWNRKRSGSVQEVQWKLWQPRGKGLLPSPSGTATAIPAAAVPTAAAAAAGPLADPTRQPDLRAAIRSEEAKTKEEKPRIAEAAEEGAKTERDTASDKWWYSRFPETSQPYSKIPTSHCLLIQDYFQTPIIRKEKQKGKMKEDIEQLLIKESHKEQVLTDLNEAQPQEERELDIEEELKKESRTIDKDRWKTKRDKP